MDMAARYVSVETLPMLPGRFPLVGHLPHMLTGFPEMMLEGRERLGPLFRIDMGRVHDLVVIADIEGLRLLSNRQAASDALGEVAGPMLDDSMLTHDGPKHRRMRGAMQRTFVPRGLDSTSVGGLIAEETQRCIEQWRPGQPVRILTATQRLALSILFRMIGCDASNLDDWARLYKRLELGALAVPGLLYLAERARDKLHARLREIVLATRAQGESDTIIGRLAFSTDEDGQLLEPAELVPTLRLLVLAGHETTASSMAWSMLELGRHPECWRRIVAEAEAVDRPPESSSELERTPFTLAFVREVVRRYPGTNVTVRRLLEDVDMLGHRLPEGAVIIAPLGALSLDPELFEAPLELRPERWLDDGPAVESGRQLERLSFGLNGPHFCLGYHLALLELVHLAIAVAKRFGPLKRSPSLRKSGMPRRYTFPLTRPAAGATIWMD